MLSAGIIIAIIVLGVMVYVLREIRRNVVLAKKRKQNQDFFLCQVSNFTVNSIMVFKKKDDLFSIAKMRNAGIEVLGTDIEVLDYTKNVPWVFYR